MRTFIAMELSQETRVSLSSLVNDLKGNIGRVSWVKPDNIHLTLKFLGEVDPAAIDDIKHRLQKVADHSAVFTLRVEKLGCFPGAAKKPRVIWAGLHGEMNRLKSLYEMIESEMAQIGFKPEKRQFSPHITLGRVKGHIDIDQLGSAIKRNADTVFGKEVIESVVLMRSELHPAGAIYTRLAEFFLPA